ncbi:hypothetical protein A2897_04595 [Candidatus Woesebacteria bacterium RIFCSPLOWO2_01_FULL_44_24b]|nr:MAG: hypothetical protein A2897_04595 [Candidatus Woesebacteria bacterium RIFCSPLOWO2_01_FULL_44_24b]
MLELPALVGFFLQGHFILPIQPELPLLLPLLFQLSAHPIPKTILLFTTYQTGLFLRLVGMVLLIWTPPAH